MNKMIANVAENKNSNIFIMNKGRSVARCREPVNVIYCYITILIQPEALISLVGEFVLCPTV